MHLCKRRCVRELLYADDLVLLGDSWKKVEEMGAVEKSCDSKRLESKCENNKGFSYSRENCSNGKFQASMLSM